MHIGNGRQIRKIKNPLMGFSITSYQSRPVNGKYHRKILNTDIMKNLVVCTLQKRRINSHHRTQPSRCQSRRKSNCMFLRNTHIKKTVRIHISESLKASPVRHGCCDSNNFFVPCAQLGHDRRKNICIVCCCPGLCGKPCFYVKGLCSVESGRVPLCRGKPFSFFGDHMDQHRISGALRLLEYPQHGRNVVSVNGA